jgi:hypothetical protein
LHRPTAAPLARHRHTTIKNNVESRQRLPRSTTTGATDRTQSNSDASAENASDEGRMRRKTVRATYSPIKKFLPAGKILSAPIRSTR